MKREAVIYLLLAIAVGYASICAPVSERKLEARVIPEEAIRLRILAHSNSSADQEIKRIIRDKVRAEISSWVEDYRSIDKARAEIEKHLPDIRHLVKTELQKAGISLPYSVQFGTFGFPTKLYGSIIYPAGEYETVLITLGDGRGANWWCVLFPPLCFLDMDSGEAVKKEEEELAEWHEEDDSALHEWNEQQEDQGIEVTFFIVEWFANLWTTLKKIF